MVGPTKRRSRWPWLALAALLAVLAVSRSFGPARDIPAGTGYAALELCTRSMQSGEPFDQVRTRYVEPKVKPLPQIWSLQHEPFVRVEVSTVLPTLAHPRAAIFRKGLGCTVVPPGTSEAAVRAQPFRPTRELAPDGRAWPLGDGAAETQRLPEPLRALVERHANTIFSEPNPEPSQGRNTTALLVAHAGHLVYERYGRGYTRERPQLGWSMTKTLTALIAGVMARDGKLALDAEVGMPQWKGTPKQAITWRQLLNMAPGLAWDEGYGGTSDATEMLFSHADEGAWAADRPLVHTPGSVFTYSTGFSNLAMRRMRGLLGGSHQALYDFYQSQLFAPLGIRHGVIEPDASGTPVGGARGLLRPLDWLRLGQLVANGGVWSGATVVPREHIAFMTAPSPADPSYGGSMWREASSHVDAGLRPRLPDDLAFFAGHLGQFVIVMPSQNLVVLRMGVSIADTMQRDTALTLTLALAAELAQAQW
jgi:CubicO group peptidase (beta-lactamase class C family)